jgi:lipopolysaccharide transport system ATP-binding protein
MSSEILIEAESLSKTYEIYAIPHHRLLQIVVPRVLALLRPVLRVFGITPAVPDYSSKKQALNGVSLTVRRGETFGVIGVNGAGKSTLLQLICGTLTPTSGHVKVHGRVAAILELGSGFNPEFSGRENVQLYASVLGLLPDEIHSKMAAIQAFADIGPAFEEPLKTYSSGMAMRVAFAVIANVDADVLIVDEALAVGDAYFQQKCMRWLAAFREKGAVLFCGHDIGTVMNLCQQALWLEAGNVRALNNAKTVCESYLWALHEESVRSQESGPAIVQDPDDAGLATIQIAQAEDAETDPQLENASSFGTRKALIRSVQLDRTDGRPMTLLHGGEQVKVTLKARAEKEIDDPIFGFSVKNKLGQVIFGTNTYNVEAPSVIVRRGTALEGSFEFQMPVLHTGDYTITAALASGTLAKHVQHHWIHDALVFKIDSTVLNGMVLDLPMIAKSIEVKTKD